jgi:hypothetical protein
VSDKVKAPRSRSSVVWEENLRTCVTPLSTSYNVHLKSIEWISELVCVKMASGSDSQRRKCVNNPNSFCYICGQYTIKGQKRNITPLIKSLCLVYFNMRLGDQDKKFAPHILCKTCVENLRQWYKGLLPSMSFGIPIVWREQINHFDNCYFCVCKVSGFNTKNKKHIVYPCLPSA